MESGWRIDVVVPARNRAEPNRIRYLAAISDQEEAKARVAREALSPIFRLEVIKAADEETMADFGLEVGDVTRLEPSRQ